MMVLVNGGPPLDRFGRSPHLGRLVSPRCGNKILPGEAWAGDNDAYLAWDEAKFVRMLDRRAGTPGCLFVAAPDVVADAPATLARFWDWRYEVAGRGYPVAFVAQDGCGGGHVPWDAFDALFVGGTTDYKLSPGAAALAREAKRRGKHLHVGRVNSRRRLRVAYDMGADSVDGSGWSKFPDEYLTKHMPFVTHLHRRPPAGWAGRPSQGVLF